MTPLEHIMGLMDPSYSEPVRRSMAQGILDQHAHDLAERQRKAIEGFDHDDHWGVLYRPDDVETLPDLNDPKAQRASTEGGTPCSTATR